ncbi:MAG: hypothetical protein KC503_05835, partial [Myxococcales bacterium]|nr:hypothetical protein [Myxococcales bacterium]
MADAMTSGALRPVHVHPSRLELAIWLAGDASEAQDEALVQHVETCRSCSAALDELRQHKSEYERSSPAELAKLRTRMGLVAGETSVWHRFVVGLAALRLATSLVALALVGVLVFVVASRLSRPPAREAARSAGALGPQRAAL